MRDYSVHYFGYVFTAEMIDLAIEKWKPKDINLGDTYEMAEIMGLEYVSDFTGEAVQLDERGDDDFGKDVQTYSCNSIFYFPILDLTAICNVEVQLGVEKISVLLRLL